MENKVTMVRERVEYALDIYDLEGPVDAVIALLHKKKHMVPEEYRASSKIEIWLCGDERPCVNLTYLRPETQRERDEREMQDRTAKEYRLQQYERLKREFAQ